MCSYSSNLKSAQTDGQAVQQIRHKCHSGVYSIIINVSTSTEIIHRDLQIVPWTKTLVSFRAHAHQQQKKQHILWNHIQGTLFLYKYDIDIIMWVMAPVVGQTEEQVVVVDMIPVHHLGQ